MPNRLIPHNATKNDDTSTVCLCMIVKNERNILGRCLDSVSPYISTWVICDTGSTDGTQTFITEYFRGINLKGSLYDTPWVDFGYNRTDCLRRAQGVADFLLMLDADEVVVCSSRLHPFRGLTPAHHAYTVAMDGPLYYRVPILTIGNQKWTYTGVTHEHLVIDRKIHSVKEWNAFSLRHHADGNNRSTKYTRDIALLTSGIQSDSGNARYHFYLAESYKNLGRNQEAIAWYEKRISMGGWAEEVYYSMYQRARCTQLLKKENSTFEIDILPLYMAAFNYRPSRLEALCQVAVYYFTNAQYARAFGYCMLAYPACMSRKLPKDILFLSRRVYTCTFPHILIQSAKHLPGVTVPNWNQPDA